MNCFSARVSWACNLLAPGAGLVHAGGLTEGAMTAAAFSFCATFAVWSRLVVPDDYPAWVSPVALLLAVVAYAAAQLRLAGRLRALRRSARSSRWTGVITIVLAARQRGDVAAAWEAFEPLVAEAQFDRVLALHRAQLLTELGRASEARQAWLDLVKLDRGGIHRLEIHRNLRMLGHPGAETA